MRRLLCIGATALLLVAAAPAYALVAFDFSGMGTVAATYGYLGSNADTQLWGAHAHIQSPLELLALLKSGPQA